MIKFWQKNWFDIEFNTFAKLNSEKQADEVFYDSFYGEFFKKFSSYDELPESWKKDKKILAEFIFQHIQGCNTILSIGCGNGFIENELSKMKWEGKLVAIEPSLNASKWLKYNNKVQLINGYFPSCLKDKETTFDFAYMSYIDYVFDDTTYVDILIDIRKYQIKDLLLIGISVYNRKPMETIKFTIKNILSMFGLLNQQLWGYQRTLDEHMDFFKKAGFKNVQYGKLNNDVYWIRAKDE